MNLYEFEGKQLLKKYGIPAPESRLLTSPEAAADMEYPFVLKAQVQTGGRGKAGGVRVCHNAAEFDKNRREIFGLDIKGHTVRALLAEQAQAPEAELYVSITLQGVSRPTLIISEAGGMDIEQVAATAPDKLIKLEIDPFTGLKGYQLKYAARAITAVDAEELIGFLKKLERMVLDTGATLAEINPLGVVNGKLVALDAKVVLDENVRPMRDTIAEFEAARKALYKWTEPAHEQTTITFVPLEGDIGLIADGAGTGMLTLDLVSDAGGRVASFCELGGVTNADVMYRALQLTLESGLPVKAVIIVLIGGFNRMDQMAEGIIRYLNEHSVNIPIYTRMCGTFEEQGRAMMAEAGLNTYYNLMETVRSLINHGAEVQ